MCSSDLVSGDNDYDHAVTVDSVRVLNEGLRVLSDGRIRHLDRKSVV